MRTYHNNVSYYRVVSAFNAITEASDNLDYLDADAWAESGVDIYVMQHQLECYAQDLKSLGRRILLAAREQE